jgi:hypothetical protein
MAGLAEVPHGAGCPAPGRGGEARDGTALHPHPQEPGGTSGADHPPAPRAEGVLPVGPAGRTPGLDLPAPPLNT